MDKINTNVDLSLVSIDLIINEIDRRSKGFVCSYLHIDKGEEMIETRWSNHYC